MSEETKLPTITEEFRKRVEEDCKIDTFNLILENSALVNRTQVYIEEYYKQHRKLTQLDQMVKEKKAQLLIYYKRDFEIKLTSMTDLMIMIEGDPKFQKYMSAYNEQKCVVEYLEKTIKNMTNKGYALKNIGELRKEDL